MREVKKKERQKPRRLNKKRVKRGNEKRRKKRTKRGRSKEDVRVLVKGEIWRVAEMFLGKTPWRSSRGGPVVNLIRVPVCVWCLA